MEKHLLIFIVLLISLLGSAQKTSIRLSGIEKNGGVIRVAVYKNEIDYEEEDTNLKFTFEKSELTRGGMFVELDLEPGKYVLAFLDDTNEDAKMNYNMLGIPKEGYAFSRIENYGYSRPSFIEALIEVKEGSNDFEVRFNYF